jgi:hypothetical protein
MVASPCGCPRGWGLFFSALKELTMTARLAETQLWQQNLASLIRSGLFSKAMVGESNGLYTVVGVYADETCSAPLAKYSEMRRATDAVNLVNRLANVPCARRRCWQ